MNQNAAPWWAPYALTAGVFGIWGAITLAVFVRGNLDQENAIIQASVPIFAGVVAYWFGSSSGSQKKDETIAAANVALAQSAPVNPNQPPAA